MNQGRAAFGGMTALVALAAASAAWAQSSDLPATSHAPFPEAAAHVSSLDPSSPGRGEAWFTEAALHSFHTSSFGASPSVWAAPPSVLRDMPSASADRGLAAPPVARYSVGQGALFVLDRSTGVALLKFEDNPEIWALQATPGPRGDVIYKNDIGEPILRATRLGGLTLFSPSAPGGQAAALVGGADDLQPAPYMSPNAVFQRMLQASARASRAAQHLITFDAAEVTPDSAPVFADAATAASEAVIDMSRRDDGRAFLKRLDRVQFQPAPKAGASMAAVDGGAHVHMQVFVDPAEGLAGRPSSERLVRAVLGR